MKPFQKQFCECSSAGLCKEKEFKSFADNPELAPAFPSMRIQAAMRAGRFTGVDLIKCGKFGGICSSGNEKCKMMRSQISLDGK